MPIPGSAALRGEIERVENEMHAVSFRDYCRYKNVCSFITYHFRAPKKKEKSTDK